MASIPTDAETVAEGTVFVAGEALPGFLAQATTPVTYCRMIWRDGLPHDFIYLYANPAFEEQLGLGKVTGKRVSEVLPDIRVSGRPTLGIYGRVAAGGGPQSFELYHQIIRKWLTVRAFSPRPGYFSAFFTNVDEKASGNRLRSTFDAMAEGFLIVNRQGEIIDHNAAAERILGMHRDVLRERTRAGAQWQPFHEDGTPYAVRDYPAIETVLTGRPLRDRVMGFTDPEGSTHWISINTQPIGAPGAPPDYAVSTFVDITARKKAEQQRHATLEAMSDGFLAIDEQWRFVHMNAAAERMLGTPREELIGRNQWEFYPATLDSPLEKAYRDAAAGRPAVFENFYEPWQRWFSCRCFPREGGGITVFFTDITEARESEEALRRSHDELRSLVGQMNALEERERSRIARELHDELQQSLAAARFEIMAVRRALGEDAPQLREIAASATRNLDLVIESTRRIVGDLRPPVLDALGLGPALETLAERLRALAGIFIEVSTLDPAGSAARLPQEVTYCLYRIAQESLNNVQKHADAARVEICLDLATPGSVELRVRDDGRGLQAVDLRKDGSYGVLGMRERLHALGGELTVVGIPAEGTLVRARVPLRSG